MSIHYFACGWILIYNLKQKEELTTSEFNEVRPFFIYIESFYLMTTTITTVGYGDYTVFDSSHGHLREIEMIYIAFVTLIGILLFSSVTNEIFNYKVIQTVGEIVKEKTCEMEVFLYDIS